MSITRLVDRKGQILILPANDSCNHTEKVTIMEDMDQGTIKECYLVAEAFGPSTMHTEEYS